MRIDMDKFEVTMTVGSGSGISRYVKLDNPIVMEEEEIEKALGHTIKVVK